VDLSLAATLEAKSVFVVFNKIDLVDVVCMGQLSASAQESIFFKNKQKISHQRILFSTNRSLESKDILLNACCEAIDTNYDGESAILSHARQVELVVKAKGFISQALAGLRANLGAEFIVLELKEALVCMQQVQGKHFDDQVLDRVFKEFCIGK
jgi:tRNA modification GTPase